MGTLDYYIILLSIVGSVFAIQYAYELRLTTKFKDRDLCSYCGRHVTNEFTMSYGMTGLPRIFKCKRWWCNLLKFFGYLTKKTKEET